MSGDLLPFSLGLPSSPRKRAHRSVDAPVEAEVALLCDEVFETEERHDRVTNRRFVARQRGVASAHDLDESKKEHAQELRRLLALSSGHAIIAKYHTSVQGWSRDYRQGCVEQLLDLGAAFKYGNDTVALAVNYFDRFLSHNVVPPELLPSLASACFFVASKFLENWNEMRPLSDLVVNTGCQPSVILSFELKLLKFLEWSCSAVTPHTVLHQLLILAPGNREQLRRHAELYIDMALCDSQVLRFSPYLVALAAVRASVDLLAAKNPAVDSDWIGIAFAVLSQHSSLTDLPCCHAFMNSLLDEASSSNSPVCVADYAETHRCMSPVALPPSARVHLH